MEKEPIILAIETATDACSVALSIQGKILTEEALIPRAHTQLVLPMIKSLVKQQGITLNDLTAIAVGRGPGSFTGVRIAMSVAQGLSYGLNIPIYPISTLQAMAEQAKHLYPNKQYIVSALDARMQEVYIAVYENQANQLQLIVDESIIAGVDACSVIPEMDTQHIVLVGSAWQTYPINNIDALPQTLPQAQYIAQIAHDQWIAGNRGVSSAEAQPVYLRDNVAVKASTLLA